MTVTSAPAFRLAERGGAVDDEYVEMHWWGWLAVLGVSAVALVVGWYVLILYLSFATGAGG